MSRISYVNGAYVPHTELSCISMTGATSSQMRCTRA